jgi:hypothetical protein
MFALNSPEVPQRVKVLYLNFDAIMDEIERENESVFFSKKADQVKSLIDAKVAELMAQLDGENVQLLPG